MRMHENSLFAVLLRSPWCASALAAEKNIRLLHGVDLAKELPR